MSKRGPEAHVKSAVLVALGRLPWVVVWDNPVGVAEHTDAHGKAWHVPYGTGGKGAPDLLCEVEVVPGCWACAWVELKSADGTLSPDQCAWRDAARRRGRHWYLARSAADALAAVEDVRRRALDRMRSAVETGHPDTARPGKCY